MYKSNKKGCTHTSKNFGVTFAKAKGGFTLIELLVVIGIIGLFATVIMASLSSARTKGQTAKRADDFQKISQALERYLIDNDDYPIAPPGQGFSTCGDGGVWTNGFNTDLDPYLSDVPTDPLNQTDADGNCNTGGQYYSFWNPLTGFDIGDCLSGTGNTVLFAAPVGIPVFRDDCNSGINSIIFNK